MAFTVGNGENDDFNAAFSANSESFSAKEISPLTVSELSRQIKGIVDGSFRDVCVVGEVSSYSQPKSGHAYFTLKDENAQIDVAVWKSTLQRVDFKLANGMKLVCFGSVEVYIPHGKYKLIARRVEQMGVGALEARFRRLEAKMRREGLFAPERKKRLPPFIRRVAAVTSPTSAAIHDFLTTLATRSKRVDVLVAPTKVQGDEASHEIAAAIEFLNARNDLLGIDAIALIRGGGSMEDLWPFNEEATVRAVASSTIPVVTGIGHEIDVSLSDLAADVHALTPTAAAAVVAPEDVLLANQIDDWHSRMELNVERRVREFDAALRALEKRRLFLAPDELIVAERAKRLEELELRLNAGSEKTLDRKNGEFRELVGKLDAMSPLAVLTRGYSLTRRAKDGKVLRDSSEVDVGDMIETRLEKGVIKSVVIG